MRAVAFATYKEWAAYRSHAAVSILLGPANLLVQVLIWRAVFAGRHELGGLTLAQMIGYYGAATLLHFLTMDFADWNLQMLIHTGRFLGFMLRPVSHVYFAFAQKVGHRALGLLIEFIPAYLLIRLALGVRLVPAHYGWTACSVMLAFAMVFLIDYCIGLTGFWLIRTDGVRRVCRILMGFCSGTFLPLALLPRGLQAVLFFLPFQFAAYVPIRVFLGSYELAGIHLSLPRVVGLQALAVGIMLLLTLGLTRLGLRCFTGVGA